jgi:hypothetical protein
MARLNRYIFKKVASVVIPAFVVWTRKEQEDRIEFRVEGHFGKLARQSESSSDFVIFPTITCLTC